MGNRQAVPPRDRARVAIVGDVHGAWDRSVDEKALRFLEPDLVLFVGDFGGAQVVKDVGRLNLPKAAILGNHDCFGGGKLKQLFNVMSKNSGGDDDFAGERNLIRALGDSHVGFGRKDFGGVKISVVGGRPFSTGGILAEDDCACIMYKVGNLEQSAEKIASQAMAAPKDHSLVFLAHNGPKGLGSQRDDVCGRDFGGDEDADYGDIDLADAIDKCRSSSSCNVPLVVFGHMHRELRDGSNRKMVKCGDDGTVYVNAAVVPRHRQDGTERNFTVVELVRGVVTKVAETWVSVSPSVALAEEIVLYSKTLDEEVASET